MHIPAFLTITAHSWLDLAPGDIHSIPLSTGRVTSQQGACHKYPENEKRGINLALLTAAPSVCHPLKAGTMNIAIKDGYVKAKAGFATMILG